MLEFLLREYRQHRMARFGVWVLAYGLALWLVDRFSRGGAGALWLLFWLAAIPVGVYYLFRLLRSIRRYFLWHLRRRLILTYFFIAVVPIGLLVLLIGIAALILNGQFASYLVLSRLHDRVDRLDQVGRVIARYADRTAKVSPEASLADLEDFTARELQGQSGYFPGLEITLRMASAERAFRLQDRAPVQPVTAPRWLTADSFSGITLDGDRLTSRAFARAHTRAGEFSVTLSQPFTPELLDQVGQGIGPVSVLTPGRKRPANQNSQANTRAPGWQFSRSASDQVHYTITDSSGRSVEAEPTTSRSLQVPPPANFLDYTIWNFASLQPYEWNAAQEKRNIDAGFFDVTSRIVAVYRQVLSMLGQYSGLWWNAFAVVGVVFLVIELVALVISWRLTRSITTTVDKLNVATERVKAGDFTHRINLPARDQLTALGEAFDGMTASVERLLKESLEKTRLEGELEIAREVQNRLFPQSAPEIAGLRLYGLCKPARTVSGDYYDFLRLGEGKVALVVGDISGKGISAALLMATLQSALHAQFYDGQSPSRLTVCLPEATAEVVSRLNRQIYASTPREKYVTLFYGVYDGINGKLTYTNAGHLPPVLFRQNRVVRLEGGGTVVGLFPGARYEQMEVQILPGDLLLAFTDGMTEPENSFGEEFGEERLLQVARRALASPPEAMMDEIYRTVSDWTGSPELQDDMTLVVAQAEELTLTT